jgi:hypothetical protein
VVFLGGSGKYILVVILFTNEDKSEAFDKQVITSVVQLVESATYTHQSSTWVYTHLPGGVKKKNQKTGFGIETRFSIFLKIKKNCLSNCQFFMKTAGSLMFLK